MGELKQRGQIWWVRYYRDGRRHEESSGSKMKGVADRLLKLREGDVAKGVPITPQVGRLTFAQAAADVVMDYRVNGKKTLAHVERRIKLHLDPAFGRARMAAISTDNLRAFVGRRQAAGASNAEINRELAIVKRSFRLAIQAGKLLAAPHVPMLQENNVRTGFFERQEFEDVREQLPAPLRPVVTFAYLTGWRVPSEVLTLEWRQVDRAEGTITLDPGTTKSGAGRLFPYGDLLPELRDMIEAQWTETKRVEQERGLVCPFVFHREGRPILDFRYAWQKACTAAGVPTKIPHDFRRTAVRALVRAGVPEQTAMQLTGHRTRSVFDRYDIINAADLRAAVGKLANAAAGTEKGQSAVTGRVAQISAGRK